MSKLWEEITKIKQRGSINICDYNGHLYEFNTFVDGNEDFGGIGILIKK